MNVHPGALVGLPPGVPNPLYDLGLWRDLLFVVAAVAGAAEWKGRHRTALVAAIAFGVAAVSFWVFAGRRGRLRERVRRRLCDR
jgi:hypothetical protein